LAPDGSVLLQKRSQPAKTHKARRFSYSGKRRRHPWAPGTYRGEYQLLRKIDGRNQVVLKSTTKVDIE
jgi:hypothetical protein